MKKDAKFVIVLSEKGVFGVFDSQQKAFEYADRFFKGLSLVVHKIKPLKKLAR